MTVNFAALLSKPADEVKKPIPLPAGTYHGTVQSYTFAESKEKRTPFVRYMVNVLGAGPEITPDMLEGIDIAKKQLRKDFYITPDSEYRIVEFAKSCSVPTTGRSLAEIITDTANQPVMFEVTQRIDGEDIYNDVGKMYGAK